MIENYVLKIIETLEEAGKPVMIVSNRQRGWAVINCLPQKIRITLIPDSIVYNYIVKLELFRDTIVEALQLYLNKNNIHVAISYEGDIILSISE